MIRCPDDDTILSLGQALEWNVNVLTHVAECNSCREQFGQLSRLKQVLNHETAPTAHFTAAVMAEVESESRSQSRMLKGIDLIGVPVVAGLTAFFAAALAARTAEGGFGSPMFVVVILTMIGSFAWNATRSLRVIDA